MSASKAHRSLLPNGKAFGLGFGSRPCQATGVGPELGGGGDQAYSRLSTTHRHIGPELVRYMSAILH